MENIKNNSEIHAENTKLEWSTPEIEIIDMVESTQAGASGTTDSGIFS